jgi:hypothetical protein
LLANGLLIIPVMLRHRWWMNPKSANAPTDSEKKASMGRPALIDGM